MKATTPLSEVLRGLSGAASGFKLAISISPRLWRRRRLWWRLFFDKLRNLPAPHHAGVSSGAMGVIMGVIIREDSDSNGEEADRWSWISSEVRPNRHRTRRWFAAGLPRSLASSRSSPGLSSSPLISLPLPLLLLLLRIAMIT